MAFGPPTLAGQSNQPNSHLGPRGPRIGGSRLPTPPRTFGGRGYSGFAALGTPQGRQYAQQHGITLPPNATGPNAGTGHGVYTPAQGTTGTTSTTGQPPAAPGQVSPLDATYWNNVANNAFQTGNRINALNLQSGQDSTALQSALAQLAYQQPRQELGLEQRANARGGLFSSVYNQQLGDMNYQYAGKQGGLVSKFGGDMARIASEIAGLQGGEQTYDQGQALLAAERAAAQAAKNPAAGSGVTTGGNPAGTAQQTTTRTGPGSGVTTGGERSQSGGQRPPTLAGQSNQPNSHSGRRGRVPSVKTGGRGARYGGGG